MQKVSSVEADLRELRAQGISNKFLIQALRERIETLERSKDQRSIVERQQAGGHAEGQPLQGMLKPQVQ